MRNTLFIREKAVNYLKMLAYLENKVKIKYVNITDIQRIDAVIPDEQQDFYIKIM